MTFGERLRVLRKQKKLTQVQLAKLAHTNTQSIIDYENNRYEPQLQNLRRICIALRVPSDALIGLTDDIEIMEGKAI